MTDWTWNGGTGDWYTAGDWIAATTTTATSPQAGDTATIAAGLAVISAADVQNFGTLDSINLTLEGALSATNEVFGAAMVIDADGHHTQATLALSGTTEFAGQIVVDGSNNSLFVTSDTLINTGVVVAYTGDSVTIDATAPLVNDGTFDGSEGTLAVSGSLTGYGVVDVGPATTLGPVSPEQILDFTSVVETLTVTGTASTGLIENFTNADAIDFVGVIANSLSYDADDGALSLFENATLVARLQTAGPETAESFRLAADGQGYALVTPPVQSNWGGTSGDWYSATQWYPGKVPQPGGLALISSNGPTITTADVAQYGSLDNELIEIGGLNQSAGTLAASGETFGAGVTIIPTNIGGNAFAYLSLTGDTDFAGTLFANSRNGSFFLTDDGDFTNTGTLAAANRDTLRIGVNTLTNDGVIEISGETTSLTQGIVIGSGIIELDSGGVLNVATGVTVRASQRFDFLDGARNELALTLANAGDFAARIDGFVRNDTIALAGLVAASTTYDPTSGVVQIFAAGSATPSAVLDIGLGFQTGDFTLATGNGTTYLTTDRATGDGSDEALHGDQARATYGVDGRGITIGIISDSFNRLGGEARDIASGDLPGTVDILQEGLTGSTDEGRAMAELIHRIAPGATLDFYGPSDGSQQPLGDDMAAGITALVAAGANIIVDDLGYGYEPYFEAGAPIEAAVSYAVSSGVDYFTAAGNSGPLYYQGTYTELDSVLPGLSGTIRANDFGGGNPLQAITILGQNAIDLILQWDQPYADIGGSSGAQNGLSMYLYDSTDTIVASATKDAIDGDPVRELYYYNSGNTGDFRLAIVWDQGSIAPGLFKYIDDNDDNGATIDDSNAGQGSGTAVGHMETPGANVVGAVDYTETPAFGVGVPQLESFSATGPGLILFGANGQSLATPVTPAVPDFVSTDGAASFSGFDPFFGTSAAAPDAAAIAALILQANPNLTTAQVTSLLEESTISLGLPASEQGAGLIQADRALALAEGACYLEGTRLACEAGETPIEQLCIGDRLRTASGELRAIRWIGRRRYDGRFAAANPDLQPIRIRPGAIADGVPTRDLFVSSRHAMFIDGLLIAAELLVNAESITRTTGLADIAYLHVELDTHDIVLAEGAPSESFVDDDSRLMFQNAGEYSLLYPDAPRIPARYCAPRPEDGAALEAVRRRLAERATQPPMDTPGLLRGRLDVVDRARIAGWAQDAAAPERPVRLRILDHDVVIGEVLADRFRGDLLQAGFGGGCCAFELIVPGGLSPQTSHAITVQRASDGRGLLSPPWVLEPTELPAPPIRRTAACRGRIDLVNRERIAGWAQDIDTPDHPVALQILDNGVLIARVLANRHRPDLAASGIGLGRHSFDVRFPEGLSPLSRHMIEVQREQDGTDIAPPEVIEPAGSFDTGLEQAVARAVAAVTGRGEQARVLSFIAAQADRLRQLCADADCDFELRSRYRQRHATPDTPMPPPGLRALVVDDRLPVAGRDGGSAALLSHMRALQRLGYAVSFVASRMDPPSTALATAGISHCTAPFYASVEDVLRRQAGGFELVYLHRLEIAARYTALVRSYLPCARILYSVADLHHVRLARQAGVERRADLAAMSHTLRQAEHMAAWSADVVLTHSAPEADILRQAMPGARVHVVPWDVPSAASPTPFATRHGIAFIGFYGHAPNLDAANWLAECVMPLVRQVDPDITLLLVGSDMPDAIRRLAGPGIVPVGHVADLQAGVFDRVRLTVAPLRYGAGVSSKALDSLAAGVPCVMSAFASEGLALQPALRTLVADDAASFAALICRLHADEAANQAASSAGQVLIRTRHDTATLDASLAAAIGAQAAGRVSIASTRSG